MYWKVQCHVRIGTLVQYHIMRVYVHKRHVFFLSKRLHIVGALSRFLKIKPVYLLNGERYCKTSYRSQSGEFQTFNSNFVCKNGILNNCALLKKRKMEQTFKNILQPVWQYQQTFFFHPGTAWCPHTYSSLLHILKFSRPVGSDRRTVQAVCSMYFT